MQNSIAQPYTLGENEAEAYGPEGIGISTADFLRDDLRQRLLAADDIGELGFFEEREMERSSVAVVRASPALTAEHFDVMTTRAEAIILIGFATGTTPDRLEPVIKKRVQSGVPVFILAANYAENNGPYRLAYAAGQGNLSAGAVLLQKININSTVFLCEIIKDAIEDGKRGQELAHYIEQMFAYHSGQQPPKAEWETPEEGVAHYRANTYEPFLRRLGYGPFGVRLFAEKWEQVGTRMNTKVAVALEQELKKIEKTVQITRQKNSSGRAPKGLRKKLRAIKAAIRKALIAQDKHHYPLTI
ncbi:hypothetical protein COV82_06055 [Candidatus Peregrinibacteria bacterium CG11_big_fil_rev_8_21_14_0_20_46_8]|nr:MAG: hypothetical protein COV82_06055 [Candidatus Peregrinibacteria bacterium CG11_big_fil_rev_8_21_14_0_20_46_8]